ncbi:MAG: hypothetical protein IJ493_13510 [Clostridia bacterium]|nr:hypothetical protein [Clostridia bacterium]
MRNKFGKRLLTLLLLAAPLTVSAVSCGGTDTPSDTTASGTTTTTPEDSSGYSYPELDCNGEEFTILNGTTTWGFYTSLDHESQTGDTLDDAIYNRNRGLEDRYNFKLNVVEELDIQKLADHIRTVIMSGEDEYDVTYCPANYTAALITENMFVNLRDIDTFQLDQPWWDQVVINEGSLGDDQASYFAASDLSLFGFEGTWCMFFNETMLENLNLDKPYDLVREGKWTIDALRVYTKAGGNLNGDDSFAWSESGNSIYGLTSSQALPVAFIIGSGERFVKNDKGIPSFSLETDRFYSLVDKMTELFASDGEFVWQNSSGKNHYEEIFRDRRALFLGAELKASQKYRDFDDTFGIVPIPKYEESQESYYSIMSKASLLMSVPVTSADPERAGIIMDALSYLSYENILPIYYEVNVSQKGLRNEDSIEMLGIIRDSRFFDVGDAYGWTSDIQNSIRVTLANGDSSIASTIASMKQATADKIAATMELYQ